MEYENGRIDGSQTKKRLSQFYRDSVLITEVNHDQGYVLCSIGGGPNKRISRDDPNLGNLIVERNR